MREATSDTIDLPAPSSRDALTELLRQGVQEIPATAIEQGIRVPKDPRQRLTQGLPGDGLQADQVGPQKW